MRLETISEDHDISDAVAALGALHRADAEKARHGSAVLRW